jgi:hypothetical protein
MIKAGDYIYSQCAATYGAEWERSIGKAPIADIKTAWLNALEPFKNSKRRIVWALQNLPERCPNAIQFKALCLQAPAEPVLALPEPAADPQRVAAALAKLAPVMATENKHDDKAWARTILISHKGGLKVNQTSLKMARDALGANA